MNQLRRSNEICLEIQDHSIERHSAVKFFGVDGMRDPSGLAARLSEQFISQNRALASGLDVQISQEYDGRDVYLTLQSGDSVGAIPLCSPTTARPDYGLVVQPRFAWSGIGPMLAEMGWRIAPTPLALPLLRRSERRVPVWVLSYMILSRLDALLDSLDRRFEEAREDLHAPRGRVDWTAYATRSLSRANPLSVPCSFPDLRDDRLLKGAVRYAAERQLRALETQKEHGAFVHRLIEFGERILRRVIMVPPAMPSAAMLGGWLQRPMRTAPFTDGLQAIEWTVDERGLAGVSDLAGIPWKMRMDQFFEAWVETVIRVVAQRTGGRVATGRNRETVVPLRWDPPHQATQTSLIPDLWVEWESTTLIVDAKYKRHWEELQQHSWAQSAESIKDAHRADIHQVLAYASLSKTPKVVACLAYPCLLKNWLSLKERERLFQKADLAVGSKTLQLWLTALPMAASTNEIAEPLEKQLRLAIQ
ncbi:MAG: hypothetical protein IH602_03220 [Bryobacteraceae bacterium]|nr:hypothetical protein [Bryobacteraceae bacterium]